MKIVERQWRWRLFACDEKTLDGLRHWLADRDAPFRSEDGDWLQRNPSQSVARMDLQGAVLVLKRYAPMRFRKRFRRAVTASRAARSWKAAERLRALGLSTPRPLMMLEERFGPLRGKAWLLTEFCPGTAFAQAYRGASKAQRKRMDKEVKRLFLVLRENRISHRDPKLENLMWHRNALWVLDLDSVRYHRTTAGTVRGSKRDRWIFLRGWRDEPEIHQHFARLLDFEAGPGGRVRVPRKPGPEQALLRR
jgi:tRNA A-37 threonylcarbamoyl transferase component Bud32